MVSAGQSQSVGDSNGKPEKLCALMRGNRKMVVSNLRRRPLIKNIKKCKQPKVRRKT